MEKFDVKTDMGLPLIKVVRFVGTLFLGFFIGAIFMIYRFEGSVDWMSTSTVIFASLVMALFPGSRIKEHIIVDEEGITFFNYDLFGRKKKRFVWQKIKAVGVSKNVLEIKNSIGSTENVKLPIISRKKREELKEYLKQLTDSKGLEYLK